MERFSYKNKLPKDNLTDTDKNAIEYFSKRNDLVITKADKGGNCYSRRRRLYFKGQ